MKKLTLTENEIDSYVELRNHLREQVPLVISKDNTAIRDKILSLTKLDLSYQEGSNTENADFDAFKKLILTVRDGLEVQKGKYDALCNKAILACLIGLLFLSIGLIVLYWPSALSFVSNALIIKPILYASLQCVLSGTIIFFSFVTAVVTYVHGKFIGNALMSFNHPATLSSGVDLLESRQGASEINLNRFFTEHAQNLRALFPPTDSNDNNNEIDLS